MDHRLQKILDSLSLNIEVLNNEIVRLQRSEQFSPTSQCFQIIERMRGNCTCTLQNLRTVERSLYKQKPPRETQADVLPLYELT